MTANTEPFDIAIVGGGINGCGIARDAAGRGLKVFLCESDDLAQSTSSASTKLLHGGLRYLEHREFRLVREALQEREVLWNIAPHIVRPLRFVLPHVEGMRPKWLLRAGLFIYDHLGGREALPGTRRIDLSSGPLSQGLESHLRMGFEYSDCWVEDARLVVLNAIDAERHGAEIRTRTRCIGATASDGLWTVRTRAALDGTEERIRARVLVNAAGPWASEVAGQIVGRPPKGRARLVQGSHIVVRKLYDHDRCFIFQNGDGRIVFTIPYEGEFTLIGTTDRDFQGSLQRVQASPEEISYLCEIASAFFSTKLGVKDVVWSYSGVRPLYDDGASSAQAATRDYTLEVDVDGPAPMLSVFGGKITTYRRLAEAAMALLEPFVQADKRQFCVQRKGWTGRTALPGGDFAPQAFAHQAAKLKVDFPFLTPQQAIRFTRYYGTDARRWLDGAVHASDLGRDFGAGLTQAELDYLHAHEWAVTADDVLWRRSKLGLHMDAGQRDQVALYLESLAAATCA